MRKSANRKWIFSKKTQLLGPDVVKVIQYVNSIKPSVSLLIYSLVKFLLSLLQFNP